MDSAGLTPLQLEVLRHLAGLEPIWTLTGGGALVGFHLGHRATRDLDLFLHGRTEIGDVGARVRDALRDAGLEVSSLQTSIALQRFLVRKGAASVVVDLVAEPVPVVEKPTRRTLGDVEIQVDTPHEILVNKLCALVQRSELRDLFDVEALVAAGGDLERGLRDAPRKDGGFSPLILAWLLSELPIESAAEESGIPEAHLPRLVAFRDLLITRLRGLCRPDEA